MDFVYPIFIPKCLEKNQQLEKSRCNFLDYQVNLHSTGNDLAEELYIEANCQDNEHSIHSTKTQHGELVIKLVHIYMIPQRCPRH